MIKLPLVHDRRADRHTAVAALELTEAELRMVAVALSHSAVNPPLGWNHPDDHRLFDGMAQRFARVANELRKADNANGAAPAVTGPRHDSQEAMS